MMESFKFLRSAVVGLFRLRAGTRRSSDGSRPWSAFPTAAWGQPAPSAFSSSESARARIAAAARAFSRCAVDHLEGIGIDDTIIEDVLLGALRRAADFIEVEAA
jgi:hypothetical protein